MCWLLSRNIRMCICIWYNSSNYLNQGGRFKNAYEFVNLEALKSSLLNKLSIFQYMGKYFVGNFKGYLWNSMQNILPIHWKKLFLFVENLRAPKITNPYAFLNPGCWDLFSWKIRTFLYRMDSIMAADNLTTLGARASNQISLNGKLNLNLTTPRLHKIWLWECLYSPLFSTDEGRLIPELSDYAIHWVETRPGQPSPKTGIPPSLYTLTLTDFLSHPGNRVLSLLLTN